MRKRKFSKNSTLTIELSEKRAWVRSLFRARDPNIHLIEGLQKSIDDIKDRLVNCVGINPRKSKYD